MIASSKSAHSQRTAAGVEAMLAAGTPRLVPTGGSLPIGEVSLGRRLRDWKTLAGFALSGAIIVFFVVTAHLDPAAIWANIRSADVRYLLLALAVYFGAFVIRGLRWRLLLLQVDLGAGVRLPSLVGLIEMIYLSWFVNCIVPAKLGDAYRAYLLKKETGADLGGTLGTVVGERMADVLALVVLLAASGLSIIGQAAGQSSQLRLVLVIGLCLGAVILAVVGALRLAYGRISMRLSERWRATITGFVESMLRTFRRDIQLPLYGLTALIWACEALRIWLVLRSFHIDGLAPGVIIFTALAGSLLSTIPFTPAGLGAVEGASVAILAAFGVATGLAGAVSIMDRLINYWSNIPVGALLYITRHRK